MYQSGPLGLNNLDSVVLTGHSELHGNLQPLAHEMSLTRRR